MARRITRRITETTVTAVKYNGKEIVKEDVTIIGSFKNDKLLEKAFNSLNVLKSGEKLVSLENKREKETCFAMTAEKFVELAERITDEEAEAEEREEEE